MNKTPILVAVLLLFANFIFAQDQGKTLVKTMDPQGTTAIDFKFRNKGIEPKIWNEGFIRVELEITANFPEAVLAQLVKAGRYTLASTIEGEVFKITAPNLDKAVSIGGKDLDDHVTINIQTPGYYAMADGVLQKNFPGSLVEEVVERSGTMQDAQKTLKAMRAIKEQVDVQYRFVYKKDKETEDAENKDKPKDAKEDKAASTALPSKTDAGNAANTGLIPSKKATLNSSSTLQEVQSLYGDIIMGGMPLDFNK
jgi:hypothetical protein